jgi:uncharacterized ion transporter superfamily protein YfcC
MVLTVLIPSTSAKAALSMPILAPIAQLNGVTGQTTVLEHFQNEPPYPAAVR